MSRKNHKVLPTFNCALKKRAEFRREDIRKAVSEKVGISGLSDSFKVLFLDEPIRSITLWGFMLKRLTGIVPSAMKGKIEAAILKETSRNKIEAEKSASLEQATAYFKGIFLILREKIIEAGSKELADSIMNEVYDFAGQYGTPLDSCAVQVLPKLNSKSASAAASYCAVDYVLGIFASEDLTRLSSEKIANADFLKPEEKEKIYFETYLELEKLATEHAPPAVKRKLTAHELRNELKSKLNMEQLDHKFRVLFLDENGQLIELFALFYERFLQNLVAFWNRIDLQKFLAEEIKGSVLESISNISIGKGRITFEILESRLAAFPKNKYAIIIHDLYSFLRASYKKAKETGSEGNSDKAISDAFFLLKEQYGALPVFSEFVRCIPEGVLDIQKRLLLSPRASEKVAGFMIAVLQKESIGEQIKAFEETKKLTPERQTESFFKIYLNLQNYILENRPSIKGKEIDISELKERIRKHVDIRDLEDKLQLLFLTRNETLVKLVRDIVKECINTFIDRKALLEAEKDLLKKDKTFKNVEIDDEGCIDFEPFLISLNESKKDKNKSLEEALSKIVFVIYERAKGILGELQAKKLFEIAYASVQRKYGASLLQVLKLIPKGVLEAEKFELLGKEEIEKKSISCA